MAAGKDFIFRPVTRFDYGIDGDDPPQQLAVIEAALNFLEQPDLRPPALANYRVS